MRKAYYVACGLVYEMAFLAALAVVWRTDGLLVLMIMAVFAMGSLSVYAVSLGLTMRRRSKQAA